MSGVSCGFCSDDVPGLRFVHYVEVAPQQVADDATEWQ